MKIDIYGSLDNSSRYYVVPGESDASMLPDDVGPVFKEKIDLDDGSRLMGFDGVEAMNDIEQNGIHIAYVGVMVGELFTST